MYKDLIEIYIFLAQFPFAAKLSTTNFINLIFELYEEKEKRSNGQINIRLKSKNDKLASASDVLPPSLHYSRFFPPNIEIFVSG